MTAVHEPTERMIRGCRVLCVHTMTVDGEVMSITTYDKIGHYVAVLEAVGPCGRVLYARRFEHIPELVHLEDEMYRHHLISYRSNSPTT